MMSSTNEEDPFLQVQQYVVAVLVLPPSRGPLVVCRITTLLPPLASSHPRTTASE